MDKSLSMVHQSEKRQNDPYDDRPAMDDLSNMGNFEKVSDARMKTLVSANLYHVDGDVATPNLCYCRQDAPVYRKAQLGWKRIDWEAHDG